MSRFWAGSGGQQKTCHFGGPPIRLAPKQMLVMGTHDWTRGVVDQWGAMREFFPLANAGAPNTKLPGVLWTPTPARTRPAGPKPPPAGRRRRPCRRSAPALRGPPGLLPAAPPPQAKMDLELLCVYFCFSGYPFRLGNKWEDMPVVFFSCLFLSFFLGGGPRLRHAYLTQM